jgi:hypothetical protein
VNGDGSAIAPEPLEHLQLANVGQIDLGGRIKIELAVLDQLQNCGSSPHPVSITRRDSYIDV